MIWVLKVMLYFHHGDALGLERYALNTQGRDDDSSHIGKSVETCVLASDDYITMIIINEHPQRLHRVD